MKFPKTAKKIIRSVCSTFAVLSLVFCVNGTIRFCLCDSDPDDCGEHCHDCSTETEEECDHVTVKMDAPLTPQSGVELPLVIAVSPAVETSSVFSLESELPGVQFWTGPPDSGGRYISHSKRLYPRS
jgi:hypothetical protein